VATRMSTAWWLFSALASMGAWRGVAAEGQRAMVRVACRKDAYVVVFARWKMLFDLFFSTP
jgi:hypothetical protein